MTEEACRRQANRNFHVFEHLRGVPYLDWAATALFYAAMHQVDAWLIGSGYGKPTSHGGREQRINRASVPRDVEHAYYALRSMSEMARYGEWQGQLDEQQLTALEQDEYQTVCDHFA